MKKKQRYTKQNIRKTYVFQKLSGSIQGPPGTIGDPKNYRISTFQNLERSRFPKLLRIKLFSLCALRPRKPKNFEIEHLIRIPSKANEYDFLFFVSKSCPGAAAGHRGGLPDPKTVQNQDDINLNK